MEKCPCESGKEYTQCCEVFITGKETPKTAEQLMRSRYSAYVGKEIAYILKTILPKKRKDIDEEGVRTWSEKTHWQRLEIRRTEKGGIQDTDGTVEFIAHYKEKTLASKHHEIAKFKRFKEQWYYVDSEFPEQRQFVRPEPKMKRNDPCLCGSGKKYKKCCGK
jgi:SEC-C motif-containing protein